MRKKRDKTQITEEILNFANQQPVTNKDAMRHLTTLKILNEEDQADTSFLKRLLADLRRTGQLPDKKDVANAEKEHLKSAILAFCQEMYPVGVRQIAYAMSSQGLIEKKESTFAKCGKIVGEMREAGDLPWEYIQDNSRRYIPKQLVSPKNTPNSLMNTVSDTLRRNIRYAIPPHLYYLEDTLERELWYNQKNYVEVWVEKKGLLGVIDTITRRWEIPLVAAAGQCSKTILYEAAQHYDKIAVEEGKQIIILYFGDYDPAGGAIYRSLENRVNRYCHDATPHFSYQAVTKAQIEDFNLPTRPVDDSKKGTAGTKDFHDTQAVDLDAIPATTLRTLVHESIMHLFNQDTKSANDFEVRHQKENFQSYYAGIRTEFSDVIEQLNILADDVQKRLED